MKKRLLSFLMCLALVIGLLPAGVFSVSAAEADVAQQAAEVVTAGQAAERDPSETGVINTSPDNPWIVTSYGDLQIAFNSSEDYKTTYIKLGADISFDYLPPSTESGRTAILYTNGYNGGGNVVLDLAGYTLSYSDNSNFSYRLISGKSGRVTINDSMRTDPSTGKLVTGKINYKYNVPYKDRNTAVLSGDVTVNGGFITNNTSSDAHHSVYANFFYKGSTLQYSENGSLIMNGGTFKAKTPVLLGDYTNTVFNGGDLRTTGQIGVNINHQYTSNTDLYLPTFKKLHIANASSNSQVLPIVLAHSTNYTNTHTKAEMLANYDSMLASGSAPFIDRVKQSALSDGAGYGAGTILGPKFNTSYDIAPVTVVDSVKLTVPGVSEGATIQYGAGCESDKGYTVRNYSDGSVWKYGVKWEIMKSTYQDLPCNETNTFKGATAYRVTVKVAPIGEVGYELAAPADLTAAVNGEAAAVKDNGDGTYDISCVIRVRSVLDNFAVTIREPAEGEAPKYNATVKSGSHYKVSDYSGNTYWKNGVMWARGELGKTDYSGIDPNGGFVFETGSKYTAIVMLTISRINDYMFADANKCTATINGKEATVYKISDNEYGVYCSFGLPKKSITSVALTVSEPLAGSKPVYDAAAPADADYKIQARTGGDWKNGVCWVNSSSAGISSGTVFEEGKTYGCVIAIEAKDPDLTAFADSFSATVNGKKADVFQDSTDNTKYWIRLSFTCSKINVYHLDITIPEPVAGEVQSYNATVPDYGYKIDNYTGEGIWRNGVMWKHGNEPLSYIKAHKYVDGDRYTVTVAIVLSDPSRYQFIRDYPVTANVNGKTAVVTKRDDSTYLVSYTFDLGGGILLGDVDGDGEVTILDATYIQRKLADLPNKSAFVTEASDADGDGEFSILDATEIQRYLAGLLSNDNIGKPVA